MSSRFEGVLAREHIPRDFLSALRERADAYGYDVSEDEAEPHAAASYRTLEGRESLHLVVARPRLRLVNDEVRLWRIDDRTLGYAASFRSPQVANVAIIGMGLVLAAVGMLPSTPGTLLKVVALYLCLRGVLMYARQPRRLRAELEQMLDAELARIRQLEPHVAPAARPWPEEARREPAAPPAPPVGVRIAPDEPALATTVRTARDAFVRHHERAPEDEVRALEEQARRRGE